MKVEYSKCSLESIFLALPIIFINFFVAIDSKGWIDDSFLLPKNESRRENMTEDMWKNMNPHHAFTTGRRPATNPALAKKIRPSQTLKQPGKLNLKSFAIVNEALARMNIGEQSQIPVKAKFSGTKSKLSKFSKMLDHVPLAAPEDDSEDLDEAEYEQITDNFSDAVNNIASQLFTYPSQDQRPKVRQRRGKETCKF